MVYSKSRTLKQRKREDRSHLVKREGKIDCFKATFIKLGHSEEGQKVLVATVTDSANRRVAKHMWLPLTEEIENLGLSFGERFEFVGTINRYVKGTLYDTNPDEDYLFVDFAIGNLSNFAKIGWSEF